MKDCKTRSYLQIFVCNKRVRIDSKLCSSLIALFEALRRVIMYNKISPIKRHFELGACAVYRPISTKNLIGINSERKIASDLTLVNVQSWKLPKDMWIVLLISHQLAALISFILQSEFDCFLMSVVTRPTDCFSFGIFPHTLDV